MWEDVHVLISSSSSPLSFFSFCTGKSVSYSNMGKFLKDKSGNFVSVEGAPVLERILERKTKPCESCGFFDWRKGDKLFIVQSQTGLMKWICPDCAVERGLPKEFYHRNDQVRRTCPSGFSHIIESMCQFWAPTLLAKVQGLRSHNTTGTEEREWETPVYQKRGRITRKKKRG